MSKAKLHENPLVSNQKLKQLYVAMVEARTLDECAARLAKARKRRLTSTFGQEACRVSTAIELGDGDLVSDTQDGVVMKRIAGASAGSLLRRLDAIRSGAKTRPSRSALPDNAARQLPWVADAGDRLRMVLGAALSLKTLGRSNLVVAYVFNREVPEAVWRRILELAAKLELPIVFIALPEAAGARSGRSLSAKAQACGVPGFPVDASDAVALYRVAQESIGRARGDGGPVVIECMAHSQPGDRNSLCDPISQMRSFMLGRKVATRKWLDEAGRGFRKRMESGGR